MARLNIITGVPLINMLAEKRYLEAELSNHPRKMKQRIRERTMEVVRVVNRDSVMDKKRSSFRSGSVVGIRWDNTT